VALVSKMCVDVVAARGRRAERGICGSIQAPRITRHPTDAPYTLQPPQRLTGRGSFFNHVLNSARGGGRHCEWSCHSRQRVKRGVPPNSDTPSRKQNS